MRAHVCALVVKEFVVDSEDATIRTDGRPNAMHLLSRIVGGNQVLARSSIHFTGLRKRSAAAHTRTSSG
jgi:hypothetical protein